MGCTPSVVRTPATPAGAHCQACLRLPSHRELWQRCFVLSFFSPRLLVTRCVWYVFCPCYLEPTDISALWWSAFPALITTALGLLCRSFRALCNMPALACPRVWFSPWRHVWRFRAIRSLGLPRSSLFKFFRCSHPRSLRSLGGRLGLLRCLAARSFAPSRSSWSGCVRLERVLFRAPLAASLLSARHACPLITPCDRLLVVGLVFGCGLRWCPPAGQPSFACSCSR